MLGLTLLECGVSRDDPAVQRLAEWVRGQRLGGTYELSLAILFLDRLGNPADEPTIRTFAGRLAAGQTAAGTWSYECPEPPPQANGPLHVPHDQLFLPHDQLFLPHDQLFLPHDEPSDSPAPLRKANIQGDHSNTQFALLGLWVARRHAAPVQPALNGAAKYFQEIQHGDGSWAYTNSGDQSRPSMTCVGLIALAMANRAKAGDGQYAPPVANALKFLGGVLDKASPGRDKEMDLEGGYLTYFLWSLERTAVIYDLRTVGDKEWYPWAAEWLVSAQRADGSWEDGLGPSVATCFALLVLKRSNMTPDLLVRRPATPPSDPADPTFAGPTIIQGPNALPGAGLGPDAQPGPIILQGPAIYQGPTVQPPRGTLDRIAPRDGAGTPDSLNSYIDTRKKK